MKLTWAAHLQEPPSSNLCQHVLVPMRCVRLEKVAKKDMQISEALEAGGTHGHAQRSDPRLLLSWQLGPSQGLAQSIMPNIVQQRLHYVSSTGY